MAKRNVKIKRPTVSKLTKAEKIAKIPIEDVSRLSGEEGIEKLREYVKSLQFGYKKRVGQFKRRNLSSYAQISLENSISEPAKKRKVNDMTRNQLLMEFARYSKFFNDVTSSVAGIELVNREQDKRIFGVDESGRAVKIMSKAERDLYWEVYDEYVNQETATFTSYGSDRVQRAIAEVMDSEIDLSDKISAMIKAKSILTGVDFDKLLAEYQRKQQGDVNNGDIYSGEKSTPNVFSGRRITFK